MLNQLQNSFIGDPVIDEISILSEIDNSLTSQNIQMLRYIGIGGFNRFSDITDRKLSILKKAEDL